MNWYKGILAIIWELPQTVLAAIIIILFKRRVTKRISYGLANILYMKGFPGGISLGRFIILNEKHSDKQFPRKHEYGHSIQSLYLGWLYLLVVGIPSLIRSIVWRLFKLDSYKYYAGYPEKWANKLGYGEEYVRIKERLK
jgi:hypothetical protein